MYELFTNAVLTDLIGAPEFLAGVWLAKLFRRYARGRQGTVIALAAVVFLLTAMGGTGLRSLLFGQPSAGFISFGFGVTVATSLRESVK